MAAATIVVINLFDILWVLSRWVGSVRDERPVVMNQHWVGVAKSGNNAGMLSDSKSPKARMLLNIAGFARKYVSMKHMIYIAALGLMTLASTAQADCFADYKAKRDNPLRLHYGVAQVSGDCVTSNAAAQLQGRLASDGWTLLNVLSVFDASGLNKRKASAGSYYLRY